MLRSGKTLEACCRTRTSYSCRLPVCSFANVMYWPHLRPHNSSANFSWKWILVTWAFGVTAGMLNFPSIAPGRELCTSPSISFQVIVYSWHDQLHFAMHFAKLGRQYYKHHKSKVCMQVQSTNLVTAQKSHYWKQEWLLKKCRHRCFNMCHWYYISAKTDLSGHL